MARIDLTPFGFTPTESLVYQVLLTGGPGTGYSGPMRNATHRSAVLTETLGENRGGSNA